ncbi:MAG: bifunctional demethylmenaquinone methyltransferase/2-methoxy-6-polyprenyl-1,4-benzoquinol methylase UbiE [Zetaproteobacteria bacterium]|nr:MAG: bifunctional demethylmenaquinone methyltransferase/2-methoxy-6-polyprenyl-1,4-benzoquinol methylase UbiE [Zetaproteobacteria bacterium]
MKNPEKSWFGEKEVSPEEKTKGVIGVFDSVADQYDLMNDLMSGGMHRLWKEKFIRMIHPRKTISGRPMDYLDVAGGTGDIAFRIRKKIGVGANITLCDLNENMLSVGQNRAIDKGWINDFEWVTGNAEALPLPDNSIDVYTIAFGLRNVTHIDTGLAEAYRVLRPGGKFFCLEFSHVQPTPLAKAYDLFSYNVIPRLGKMIANDEDSYQYLVESIRKFPTQEQLLTRIQSAGFCRTRYNNLSAGIVAIHQGTKR